AQHVAWGVIVLVFSVLSIVSFGGFIVGMAFGIVGGAIGMAWGTPQPMPYVAPYGYTAPSGYGASYGHAAPYVSPAPYAYAAPSMPMGPWGVPVTPWRMCTGCGRWVPWAYGVCPMCGTQTPVAPWAAAPAQPTAPAAATTQAPAAFVPAPSFGAEPAPPPITAPCPTCDGDAEWLPMYKKWYCAKEFRYF
ncbi:MAG: hypothetical protein AABY30_05165, partial [Candidatus Thermoplasmatota archaeon]